MRVMQSIIKGREIICFLWMLPFLTSCHTIHATHPTSLQQAEIITQQSIDIDKNIGHPSLSYAPRQSHIPQSINSALLPPLSHYVNREANVPPHFDVTANNVPTKEFFVGLVAGTNYNLVIDPNINGTISLNLKNVTLRQALDAVRDIYGYDYRRTSYGFEVLPPQLQTQIFHINYLDIQRSGKSFTQVENGEVTSVGTINVGGNTSNYSSSPPTSTQNSTTGVISSIETKSEMLFWKDIEKAITNIVGTGNHRSVTVNAQAGIVSVHAYPIELRNVSHYINSLQSSLNRQVILEAKILEVDLNDAYQAGVDWSILGNPAALDDNGNPILNATGHPDTTAGIGQAGDNPFRDTDLTALHGIFAVRINGNFKLLIKLLQSQGNVQILSSPHISTVNNQKAVIKVGQDEFFVTGVSTSNTIIGTNTLPSQNVSLTPFFSGVTLDVTPEISSDNTVILHIHPTVSNVTEQTKMVGLGTSTNGAPNNLTLPLARSTIRESDNIVRAKNGQVVVIGGLMQNNMSETLVATPWLSQIPFLGAIFRRTEQKAIKSELIILLRPMVASNKNYIKTLENNKKTFQILKRPFHAGGLTKIFGNEGERASNE